MTIHTLHIPQTFSKEGVDKSQKFGSKHQIILKNAVSDSMRILSNLKSLPNLRICLIWTLPGIVVLI